MVYMGKRVPVVAYLEPEQKEALDELSEATRRPTAVYMREAVNDLLRKYASTLRGEKPLFVWKPKFKLAKPRRSKKRRSA